MNNMIKRWLTLGVLFCVVLFIVSSIKNDNTSERMEDLYKKGQEYLKTENGVQYIRINEEWVKAEDVTISSWSAFKPTYIEYNGVMFKVGDSAFVSALKFLSESGIIGKDGG